MYPLYIEHDREMRIGVWLDAGIGELVDETHVRSRTGSKLALRPGFHSTLIPFTDWIGKKVLMVAYTNVVTRSGASVKLRGRSRSLQKITV